MKDRSRKKPGAALLFTGLSILLLVLFIIALGIGRYPVPVGDVFRILFGAGASDTIDAAEIMVVWTVRFPRLIANILVGASLALSGAVYQSMFRNPLVSGDILGVSGGAAVGASIGIILGLHGVLLQMSAFTLGILAVLLVTFIARLFPSRSSLVLVLAGVIVGGFSSSILSLIKYVANPLTRLPEIVFWLMGSMSTISTRDLLIYSPMIVLCCALTLGAGWRLNIMSLGDSQARSLGVDVRKMRFLFVTCATIITASCVSMCGMVGWFSLVVPHLGRLLTGNDNQKLLPVSALCGACFMILMDTAARTLTSGEIPLGILTGMIGTPAFALILIKRRKSVA